MNNVSLIGRLTRDPELFISKNDQGNLSITRYTLAIDRRSSEIADFISCVCFGKTAEFAAEYLVKGMKIGVTGKLQSSQYEDKDGVTHYTTDVVVDSHHFCEKKQDVGHTSSSKRKGKGNSRR